MALGITRHWASHGIGHHTALGLTRHWASHGMWIPGGRTYTRIRLRRWRLREDTLTTMATTRGYAYDDGRSMERPYKAVGITWHWASHGIGHHTALGITRHWASHGIGHHMALGITQHVDTGGMDIHADTLTTMATTHGDTLTTMAVPRNDHYILGIDINSKPM